MKKFLIAALAAGMLFTGCANSNAGGNAPQPAKPQAADASGNEGPASEGGTVSDADGSASSVDGSAAGGPNAAPDGRTVPVSENGGDVPAPPEVKMVYGEISELIGNAVTVKEIEMPRPNMRGEGRQFEVPLDENGEPDFSQMELPEGVTLDENGRPDFGQMERPEGGRQNAGQGQIPDAAADGTAPGGGMPEGFTPGEGGSRPNRQGGPGGNAVSREPEYTGEEIEIFIPVGLPITTAEANDQGVTEETEIQLNDIAAGDMITVMYKEDGTTIDSVSIS